jgi:cytochrome P450
LELVATSSNFIVGGAETTSTVLTGLLYYLLANDKAQFCLSNLTSQFRLRFGSAENITMDFLTQYPCEDLDCCINEGLRLFPPLPGNLRRIVPPEGKLICGKWVPGGTLVAVDIFSANISSYNFALPNHFVPERWLPEGNNKPEIFNNDKLDAVQTFSFGPRNCIGRNLAMMEIKLILVRLLREFDIELEEESKDWIDRVKACEFFIKPNLMVRCRDRDYGTIGSDSDSEDSEDTDLEVTDEDFIKESDVKPRNVRWFD